MKKCMYIGILIIPDLFLIFEFLTFTRTKDFIASHVIRACLNEFQSNDLKLKYKKKNYNNIMQRLSSYKF